MLRVGKSSVATGVKQEYLTKIELVMLVWPLAGDCLEVEGDSF